MHKTLGDIGSGWQLARLVDKIDSCQDQTMYAAEDAYFTFLLKEKLEAMLTVKCDESLVNLPGFKMSPLSVFIDDQFWQALPSVENDDDSIAVEGQLASCLEPFSSDSFTNWSYFLGEQVGRSMYI